MTLVVHVPDNCLAERRYVVSLVFEDFLGIPATMVAERRTDVAIRGPDGKELILADTFFAAAEKHWLGAESMPRRPLRWVELPHEIVSVVTDCRLPIVFGDANDAFDFARPFSSCLRSSMDIFGSAFFLSTRYEELAAPAADERGRFPVEASLARREGLLDRPIVDECVELLWWLMSQLWPQLRRKQHRYRLCLSHDVDSPYRVLGRPAWHVAAAAGADVVLGRGLGSAAKRLTNAYRVYRGDAEADPYNTFDFILSTSEVHSIESAFYFITRQRTGRLDGTHRFQSRPVEQLLQAVHERGHEIGLHPGYATYRSSQDIADEFALLREKCDRLGVTQSAWGGRQHYLRWQNPDTWAAWDDAGLDYDSSVGYVTDVGFRCGTCREFPVYDLVRRRPLRLRERPLVVMECALSYRLHQPAAACFERVTRLIERCRKVNGNFTLLWHNNNLASSAQRAWYRQIIAAAA